jgi:hypothetical protein
VEDQNPTSVNQVMTEEINCDKSSNETGLGMKEHLQRLEFIAHMGTAMDDGSDIPAEKAYMNSLNRPFDNLGNSSGISFALAKRSRSRPKSAPSASQRLERRPLKSKEPPPPASTKRQLSPSATAERRDLSTSSKTQVTTPGDSVGRFRRQIPPKGKEGVSHTRHRGTDDTSSYSASDLAIFDALRLF